MNKEMFLVNYYRWAKDQFDKEFAHDFVHLRTIASCQSVVEFIENLSERRQAVLISALVKRAHSEAIASLGEIITEDESMLLRDYISYMRYATIRYRSIDSEAKPLNRRNFTKSLETAATIIGENIERGGLGYRRFLRSFGAVTVETIVDATGRIYQLQYEHRVFCGGALIHDGISIGSWLGIAPGATGWKKVSDDNSHLIVSSFCEICSLFMNAMSSFVTH